MDDTALFGYGSLVSPTSTVQRCSDRMDQEFMAYWDERDDTPLVPAYRDFLATDTAATIRDEDYDHLAFIPGRLDGFKRQYDTLFPNPNDPNGSQLSVGADDDHWINGVVVTGLTDTEREAIDDTESMYEPVQVPRERFQPYSPIPDDVAEDIPDEITVYVRDPDHPQFARRDPAPPMEAYQETVFDGFDTLAQEYVNDDYAARQFAKVMKDDFRATTYWKDPDSGDWTTLMDTDPFA